jgi:hypothetical protein
MFATKMFDVDHSIFFVLGTLKTFFFVIKVEVRSFIAILVFATRIYYIDHSV